jgi:transcriptional regulator with XRE-family HTH domain
MVGRRLRMRRKLLGRTQQELAAAIGITFQQIQKYESAYCRISVAMLWKLAHALEVDITYFFEGLSEAADSEIGQRAGAPQSSTEEPHRADTRVSPEDRSCLPAA